MSIVTSLKVAFWSLFAGRCHIKAHLPPAGDYGGLWMSYTRHAPRCGRRAVAGIDVTNGAAPGHMALCRGHAEALATSRLWMPHDVIILPLIEPRERTVVLGGSR